MPQDSSDNATDNRVAEKDLDSRKSWTADFGSSDCSSSSSAVSARIRRQLLDQYGLGWMHRAVLQQSADTENMSFCWKSSNEWSQSIGKRFGFGRFDDDDEYGPRCMSCGGEGIVRFQYARNPAMGWDDDGREHAQTATVSGLSER